MTCPSPAIKALVEGSILGAQSSQAEGAADASGSGETEAPSGPSIVNGEKNMDTASSTPNDDNTATITPPMPEPAPLAEPASDEHAAGEPPPEPEPVEPTSALEPA